jgi:hypothetical protein
LLASRSLETFTLIFDEPRKITKKERAPRIDTKPQKVDLLLVVFKMISNNSQQFGMRGETLFIEDASTSFSFFINYFSLKIA